MNDFVTCQDLEIVMAIFQVIRNEYSKKKTAVRACAMHAGSKSILRRDDNGMIPFFEHANAHAHLGTQPGFR